MKSRILKGDEMDDARTWRVKMVPFGMPVEIEATMAELFEFALLVGRIKRRETIYEKMKTNSLKAATPIAATFS